MTHSSFSLHRGPVPERVVTLALITLAFVWLLSGHAAAQTPVVLSPVPKLQFLDANGKPLASGCVFSYATLSSTPLSTYTDYSGTVTNTNPLILTSGGFVGTGGMWLQAGLAYRLVVKSAGGTNCASGSTISTVDGIGGGTTVLTTIVTYSATPVFTDAAQVQLFEITLTGSATSQPLTATGITPPGIIYFQITQDASGGHTFAWPANVIGGCAIGLGANQVTTQAFVWNGTNATAVSPCVTGSGPAITAGSIIDSGLTASSPLCTDSNKQLSSTCNSILGVTYNGQTVNPGGSGNVNAGAAAHSMALNEGAGVAITGLTLGAHQLPIGQTGADPVATTVPDCQDSAGNHLNYTQSSDTIGCGTSVPTSVLISNPASLIVQSTTNGACSGNPGCTFTFPQAFSSTPACLVAGNNGSANIAPGSPSTTAVSINSTVATVYILCIGPK